MSLCSVVLSVNFVLQHKWKQDLNDLCSILHYSLQIFCAVSTASSRVRTSCIVLYILFHLTLLKQYYVFSVLQHNRAPDPHDAGQESIHGGSARQGWQLEKKTTLLIIGAGMMFWCKEWVSVIGVLSNLKFVSRLELRRKFKNFGQFHQSLY